MAMDEIDSIYEYTHRGVPITLSVSYENEAREPRVRWQVGTESGDRGRVQFRDGDPVLQLDDGDTVPVDGERRSLMPVPEEIAEAVRAERERLETITAGDDESICTDPSAFPKEIAGFERVGWETERHVMWYLSDDWSEPRAYQIENGNLVFRAQEWADLDDPSKDDIVDDRDLMVLNS